MQAERRVDLRTALYAALTVAGVGVVAIVALVGFLAGIGAVVW